MVFFNPQNSYPSDNKPEIIWSYSLPFKIGQQSFDSSKVPQVLFFRVYFQQPPPLFYHNRWFQLLAITVIVWGLGMTKTWAWAINYDSDNIKVDCGFVCSLEEGEV